MDIIKQTILQNFNAECMRSLTISPGAKERRIEKEKEEIISKIYEAANLGDTDIKVPALYDENEKWFKELGFNINYIAHYNYQNISW